MNYQFKQFENESSINFQKKIEFIYIILNFKFFVEMNDFLT